MMLDQQSPRPAARAHVDRSDLYSGLFFMSVAVLGLFMSRDFAVGTAVNMGEGYVPRLICWIMLGIGAVIAIRAFARPTAREVDPLVWRPIIFVLASVVAFGLTLEKLGLIVAIPLLIAIGSLAGRNLRLVETATIALVLCFGIIAVFSWGLGLTIPVLPRL